MNFVQGDKPEAAKKLAVKLTSKLNPGLKEIVVNNCFELTSDEIKKVPSNRLLTLENFNQWGKIEKSGSRTPDKPAEKKGTIIPWLKNIPVVKSVTTTLGKAASKPVTQIPWLKKKSTAKPVEKQSPPALKTTGDPDWDLINKLPHNQEIDNYSNFSVEEKKLIKNLK
jgi:hypothetical protein